MKTTNTIKSPKIQNLTGVQTLEPKTKNTLDEVVCLFQQTKAQLPTDTPEAIKASRVIKKMANQALGKLLPNLQNELERLGVSKTDLLEIVSIQNEGELEKVVRRVNQQDLICERDDIPRTIAIYTAAYGFALNNNTQDLTSNPTLQTDILFHLAKVTFQTHIQVDKGLNEINAELRKSLSQFISKLDPDDIQEIYRGMIDQLIKIHAVDPQLAINLNREIYKGILEQAYKNQTVNLISVLAHTQTNGRVYPKTKSYFHGINDIEAAFFTPNEDYIQSIMQNPRGDRDLSALKYEILSCNYLYSLLTDEDGAYINYEAGSPEVRLELAADILETITRQHRANPSPFIASYIDRIHPALKRYLDESQILNIFKLHRSNEDMRIQEIESTVLGITGTVSEQVEDTSTQSPTTSADATDNLDIL